MAEEQSAKKGWVATGEPIITDAVQKAIEKFGSKITPYPNPAKEATIKVEKEDLYEILDFLKKEIGFDYLSDIASAHFPQNEKHLSLAYHLFSIEKKDSLRVKVEFNEEESIPSVSSIWPAANWMEREAYDLMGVKFGNHPNLKRILLPDDWEGYPLRKEYPLGGPQEEEIRSNRYGVPSLLPDDLEAAKKILEEEKNE